MPSPLPQNDQRRVDRLTQQLKSANSALRKATAENAKKALRAEIKRLEAEIDGLQRRALVSRLDARAAERAAGLTDWQPSDESQRLLTRESPVMRKRVEDTTPGGERAAIEEFEAREQGKRPIKGDPAYMRSLQKRDPDPVNRFFSRWEAESTYAKKAGMSAQQWRRYSQLSPENQSLWWRAVRAQKNSPQLMNRLLTGQEPQKMYRAGTVPGDELGDWAQDPIIRYERGEPSKATKEYWADRRQVADAEKRHAREQKSGEPYRRMPKGKTAAPTRVTQRRPAPPFQEQPGHPMSTFEAVKQRVNTQRVARGRPEILHRQQPLTEPTIESILRPPEFDPSIPPLGRAKPAWKFPGVKPGILGAVGLIPLLLQALSGRQRGDLGGSFFRALGVDPDEPATRHFLGRDRVQV